MKVGDVNVLIVTNLSGQSEPITKYSGYERFEEVSGSLELSFTSFFHADNPGHELITGESIIEKDGYEFVVKQLTTKLTSKQVVALSTFFDLNAVRKDSIFGGTKTFDEFASWLFTGTNWAYENVDVNDHVFIPNFGNGNVIELLTGLIAAFDCEYQILPNNQIRFAKQIGPDNDAQYRYGHNIKALSLKEDTTKLRTRIKGIGGNGLEVIYTSPNAEQFGIRDAEPVSDERFTISDSLLERIKQDLIDYPEVSIELDAIELQQKEIGERVWLIYEPLNTELQTRILAKKSRIPETLSTVTIGNTVPKTLGDILSAQKVEIKENARQTQSKIEQTNERITLEVERVDESIATLTIEADQIQLNVQAIDGRLGTAESQISVQAGQISSKVSYTDYNGNTIASLINQSATTIDIQASKINLVGAVSVLSDISGSLGSITAGNITGTTIRGGQFVLDGGILDVRLGSILWGDNLPQASYAANAGNAHLLNGAYTYADFSFVGHSHQDNQYVKPSSGQDIKLGVGGTTLNVYLNNSLVGTIPYN